MRIFKRKTYVRYPPQNPKELASYMRKELQVYRDFSKHQSACKREKKRQLERELQLSL